MNFKIWFWFWFCIYLNFNVNIDCNFLTLFFQFYFISTLIPVPQSNYLDAASYYYTEKSENDVINQLGDISSEEDVLTETPSHKSKSNIRWYLSKLRACHDATFIDSLFTWFLAFKQIQENCIISTGIYSWNFRFKKWESFPGYSTTPSRITRMLLLFLVYS